MKTQLVISRFNENIDWLNKIPNLFDDIFVYNKGEDNILSKQYKIIKVKNVGREAQTYLQFIIDNYDNLADYTLFSQAHPFDRGWNGDTQFFINQLNFLVSIKPNETTPLGWVNVETLEVCPPMEEHKFIEMNYKKEYESIFNEVYPNRLVYSSGATIWVPRKNILYREKQFYCKLNETVNKEVHPKNAWILERFWLTIFKNV